MFYTQYIKLISVQYSITDVSLANTYLEKYDVVQNSALIIITGGVKSTPITAMQLQTSIEHLDSHSDKFPLKFCERFRRMDFRHWNGHRCATQRLKTQTSLSNAELLMKKYQLLYS
ncbi:hypothetical protein TNCV_4721391 [Trichonephila clavipes]|uniref:Uncharacterized protein n=1 Tax=Trichonephila clavipes TaxID=2585209 RepID=A0A8X7BEN7_TRICX|nr:hypothetical protein TNCV_4721391 [Trichonephila clavipes]